jgi:beta-N-acetylhexosaminidase
MKHSLKDLYSQVGQCMIMGFEDVTMTGGLKDLLQTIQPGGVILFARNIADAHQTHLLLGQCQDLAQTPMFTCVDMEGGTVDRFRGALTQSPSAAEVYASGDARLFRRHGRTIGAACRALGFNTDFAPVLDLAQPGSGNVLGTRAVSADGREVARYGKEFLRGLSEERVFGCGKHFPGLGDADLDTHQALPRVNKAWKPFWKEDLEPYRVLRSEMAFVMVAHAVYPSITQDDVPASLSRKWITDMLRGVLDYQGLIVSDDLEMGAVLAKASVGEAAVTTLGAGADMFLVCQTEKNVLAAFEAVIHAAEKDPAFAETVAKAADRVMRFKKCSRELRGFPMSPTQSDVDALKRRINALAEDVAAAAREMAHA